MSVAMKFIKSLIVFVVSVACSAGGIPEGYTPGKLCRRTCDGNMMKCFYHFKLETYLSMSGACGDCPTVEADCFQSECVIAGGVQRAVTVVNRQLPGPPIVVCQGDRVRVLTENHIESGEATTIHWHGQFMNQDPYMDGVPYVTQCPILYNNNFTYDFQVDTPGTHFYHSHVEVQRGDGLYGALIVHRTPEENIHRDLYEYDLNEHVMMITDWNDEPRIQVFQRMAQTNTMRSPTGILVNGLGFQRNHSIFSAPLATFFITKGHTYRFRLINTNFFDCPWEFTIDKHTLKVIATDGQDIVPVDVDAIATNSAERYDFVINATGEVDTYWIKIKGYGTCANAKIFGVALLKYQGSDKELPNSPVPEYENANNPTGMLLNPFSKKATTQPFIALDELKSVKPLPNEMMGDDVTRLYITLDMDKIQDVSNSSFLRDSGVLMGIAQFNDISFKSLDFPLLPERRKVDKSAFCNSETMKDKNCKTNYCACPHIIQLKTGAVVELVIINRPPEAPGARAAMHPMHLHGNNYRVLRVEEFGFPISKTDVKSNYTKILGRINKFAVLKDSAAVPINGVMIIRFIADTPGYWIMHCHIDVHAMLGMIVVFNVGENDEIPDAPEGFPTCGNFDNLF